MKIPRALVVITIISLAVLAFILGGTPARFGPAVFSQAPTSQPEDAPEKKPEKLATEAAPEKSQASQTPEDAGVQAAFQQAVTQKRQSVLGFLVFEPVVDSIHYSADGATALLWVSLRDPQTGEVVASEPGLSIARNLTLANPAESTSWDITFQTENNFTELVQSLPADLLTDDVRTAFLQPQNQNLMAAQTFTGYKLPWTAGVAKRVTNSIGHYLTVSGGLTSCPTTCQYAFDFADGTMFPLLAAKGGVVQSAKWTCPNGGTACTNFLILRDESTIPTTYQVYYHMAYNTLPDRLRSAGAAVEQGEYIGNADDTGYSTGHHLHFHVYTAKTAADYSWGYSVDITFADVSDNGGRPRTCAEATQYPNLGNECQTNNSYTSGNTPRHPPSATLVSPADRTIVTNRTVQLAGSTSDDIGISRIQVLANYDGSWKTIDDVTPAVGSWSRDVDLCAANIPDGPFGLTVRVYDVEGSQAPNLPVRQVIKSFSCASGVPQPPPPTCVPNDNQVVLYADRDFQGACNTFTLNNAVGTAYTVNQLGALKDNDSESIWVGKNVRVILFDRSEDVSSAVVNGRSETFETSDASFSDNRIGLNTVSGVYVESLSSTVDEPFFHAPFGSAGAPGSNPSSVDSLVLAWEGGEGAASFDIALDGPGANISTSVSGSANSISVGSLAPGTYNWSVKAVNRAGSNTTSKSFTVSPGALPAASTRTAPYQEDFEAGSGDWAATGLWHYGVTSDGGLKSPTNAWLYNNSTNYTADTWRAGDLTSPPIVIPSSGTYYLRFSYFADVEDGNGYWDQRWVQLSVDGGPFVNWRQLKDDKQAVQAFLNSDPIALDGLNGKTIRVRFHFDTIDEDYNGGKGWYVDDVKINDLAPDISCADNGAVANLAANTTLNAVICPEGDIDIYRIYAVSGQPFKVDIDARTLNPASKLDSIIYLLDSDGSSVLAENDDEIYGQVVDSLLSYLPTRTGYYFVKVKAWQHPGAGGAGYFYNISLVPQTAGQVPRSVSILYPYNPDIVPTMPFEISAAAEDYDNTPVSRVDFYWHGSDWSQPDWVKLMPDTNPADGWSVIIDPLSYGAVTGGALYVQATSKAGGVKGTVMWDLRADTYPPVSTMAALPAVINSTTFKVSWDASDVGSDVDYYNLQYQVNGGAWTNWTPYAFPSSVRSAWVWGPQGAKMGFRVRAGDRLGNVENFPANAQSDTTIESSCAPDTAELNGESQANPTPLQNRTLTSTSNLCKSAAPGSGGPDEDWYAFTGEAGQPIHLMVLNSGGGSRLQVQMYNSSDALVGHWIAPDIDSSFTLGFFLGYTGTFKFKISAVNDYTYGTNVKYQLWFGNVGNVYLPGIQK